jgi:carboxypeptidase Taq
MITLIGKILFWIERGVIMTKEKLDELNSRITEVNDIRAVVGMMFWDQLTYLPHGGTTARGRQMGTIRKIAHKKFTDPAIGNLLDGLAPYERSLDYDSDDAAIIRVTRREYERSTKVPSEFLQKWAKHNSEKHTAWVQAREANDFSVVKPMLEQTLDFSREYANYFPGYEHIADPLIDRADYGMKTSAIRSLFSELREELIPIVKKLTEAPETDDSCMNKEFPEKQQLEFGKDIAIDFGYDFNCGRLDKSPHPFTMSFSISDVRITTRVNTKYLRPALFSTLHEAGHGIYEQKIDRALEETVLAGGTSSGVHESQSRLWEKIVGRSIVFWKHYYPKLQQTFPGPLSGVSLDTFHKAINKVKKSPIRTDADEVTYNLHVMIRFDLEVGMLEGKLDVGEMADVWRERYLSDLGLEITDDNSGCLQDIHWFQEMIGGMFQG